MPPVSTVGLRKALEDLSPKLFGDALAAVDHRNAHLLPKHSHAHRDPSAALGELGSIGQQINQHLHHAVGISTNDHAIKTRFKFDLHAVLVGIVPRRVDSLVDQRRQRLHDSAVGHHLRLDLLDVEHVVDQTYQALAATQREVDQFVHIWRELAGHTGGEQTERAINGG